MRLAPAAPISRVSDRLSERWARATRFLTAATGTPPGKTAVALHVLISIGVRATMRYPILAARRSLHNERALADAISEGKGVIVAHTHLFGPAYDSITVAAHGYGGTAVSVEWPEDKLDRLERLRSALTRSGGDMMFRGEGSLFDQVAAGLREGRVFHMSVDVPGSKPVTFLGRPARVSGGVGSLAVLTGARIVPVSPTRTGLGVRVHEPLERTEDADALTQRLCDWASAEILSHPYAWEDNDIGLVALGLSAG